MCNLYSLNKKRDAVARFFRVSHNRAAGFEPVTAIFPKHVAPVVRQASDGEREIVTMSWGFMRLEKGRAPKPVTNVRDDQIQTNPFCPIVVIRYGSPGSTPSDPNVTFAARREYVAS